jgi:hypothetical protein
VPHTLEFDKLFRYDRGADGIVIHVRLDSGNKQVEFDAKIDTAATYCVFEGTLGEDLGLNIESGIEQRFGTALGVFTAYGHQLYLEALGFRLEAYVFFASDSGMTKNVLGWRGWLDMLRIGIVDYDGELYLSRYDKI